MEPIDLEGGDGSGWVLVHRCTTCGYLQRNGTSEHDPRQPDEWGKIVAISGRRR